MFIITILFAVLTPFVFSLMINQIYGNIINLHDIKSPKGTTANEENLPKFLLLGYLIPTALLAAITMFDVIFSTNDLIVKFALIASLLIIVMFAGAYSIMLELQAADLAADTREKFDNSQSGEGESAPTHNEPTSHEWIKDLYSEQEQQDQH